MDKIRLATAEEIEKIASSSDLNPGDIAQSRAEVWAMANGDREPIFGVIRKSIELDPVHIPEGTPDTRKAAFIWGLETGMRMRGVPYYYFNIHERDKKWKETCEKFGAEVLSTEPEFRMKKVL